MQIVNFKGNLPSYTEKTNPGELIGLKVKIDPKDKQSDYYLKYGDNEKRIQESDELVVVSDFMANLSCGREMPNAVRKISVYNPRTDEETYNIYENKFSAFDVVG
ncbi:MAG: hypothetical protein WCK67_02990 [bacterium]